MAIGASLLNLMGQKDPRQQLLAAALGQPGGGGATPAGAAGAPAGTPPGGGAPQPHTPPQPTALQSQPDMLSLYSELMDRSRKESSIDRGMNLIAAGFAAPENRAALINSGGGQQESSSEMMNSIIGIQQRQSELAEKAAARQRALSVGKELGVSDETALFLSDSDQLDDLWLKKFGPQDPNNEIREAADGSLILVDKNTGKVLTEVAPGGAPPTADMKDYDHYVQDEAKGGRQPLTFQEWRMTKPPSVSITNKLGDGVSPMDAAVGDLVKEADKVLIKDREMVGGAVSTIDALNQARVALNRTGGIVAGSPLSEIELQSRRALGSLFGVTDDAVINSDQYMASLAPVLTGRIKELGTGNAISDADRKFMEGAVGMDRALSPVAMERILNGLEIGTRNTSIDYNARVDARIASVADAEMKKYLETLKVPVPPLSAATISHVTEEDLQMLLANADNPGALYKFEIVYGRNTAAEVLRLANAQ